MRARPTPPPSAPRRPQTHGDGADGAADATDHEDPNLSDEQDSGEDDFFDAGNGSLGSGHPNLDNAGELPPGPAMAEFDEVDTPDAPEVLSKLGTIKVPWDGKS